MEFDQLYRHQNLMLSQALKQDLLNNNESALHNWSGEIQTRNSHYPKAGIYSLNLSDTKRFKYSQWLGYQQYLNRWS